MEEILLFVPALMQAVNTDIALTGMNILAIVVAVMAYLLVGSYIQNEILCDAAFVAVLAVFALFGAISHVAWVVAVVVLVLNMYAIALLPHHQSR